MRRSAAALLALCAAAGPARGFVVSEDELADRSLVVGVIARAFSFVLGGDILRPPYVPEDASPSAVGLFDLRPYLAWREAHWKLVVHDQLTSAVRSHAALGPLALGRGVAPPRLFPLRAVLADGPTLSLTSTVDWAYAAYSQGPVTVTLGRQPVTFGRAKLWKPTDLVGTFALTEVDTEYKPGSDALRLDWSPGARTQVTVVAATGSLGQDGDLEAALDGTSALARFAQGWDGGELGLLLGMVRGDAVAGADLAVDTGDFELHGEAVATLVTGASLAAPAAGAGSVVLRAVAGATFHPTAKLTLAPELMYNGFGAAAAADDLATAGSQRVAVGEQILLGRAYAGAVADLQLHPLVHLGAVALVNLTDPSALISVALSYSVASDVVAQLGGYVPLGARPAVAGTPAARSEYGLYPLFGFIELKAAL